MDGEIRRVPSIGLGVLVGEKYRITSLLGAGAVGQVYLARQTDLDIDVAIKILRPEMIHRPDVVRRFAREIRACVRVRSERVARVYDVGTHNGSPFFVMERLVGADLAALIPGGLDVARFAELMIQACEGLADAHAQSIVHRDLKPGNLFVARDTYGWLTLKILDFGISKVGFNGRLSDSDLGGQRIPAIMGTPEYMSPEQIRSAATVDHRADIWSLGVVMFEALSRGIMPFSSDDDLGTLVGAILEEPHRRLRKLAPDLPADLEAIVDHCLVKDPAGRYQSTAEVALALLPFAPKRARVSVERATAIVRSLPSEPTARAGSSSPALSRRATPSRWSTSLSLLTEFATRSVKLQGRLLRPALAWLPIACAVLLLAAFELISRFTGGPANRRNSENREPGHELVEPHSDLPGTPPTTTGAFPFPVACPTAPAAASHVPAPRVDRDQRSRAP